MTSSPVEPADLLDLRLLPAWVKEPMRQNVTRMRKATAIRGPSEAPSGYTDTQGKALNAQLP